MLTITASVVFVAPFTMASVFAFEKTNNTAGNESGKKMLRAETATSKDGEKGDKGGGKSGGKPDTSLGVQGLTMGKDGGDKGEGKGGGKKRVVAPIDGPAMRGQPDMSRSQMNRSVGHGNAGMDRSLDGLNR
jgi:hypothetical protein